LTIGIPALPAGSSDKILHRLCDLAEGGVPMVLLQRMSPFMADTVEKGF
jgi:hypothetical protein